MILFLLIFMVNLWSLLQFLFLCYICIFVLYVIQFFCFGCLVSFLLVQYFFNFEILKSFSKLGCMGVCSCWVMLMWQLELLDLLLLVFMVLVVWYISKILCQLGFILGWLFWVWLFWFLVCCSVVLVMYLLISNMLCRLMDRFQFGLY